MCVADYTYVTFTGKWAPSPLNAPRGIGSRVEGMAAEKSTNGARSASKSVTLVGS